jgi:chemotaxis protein CheD
VGSLKTRDYPAMYADSGIPQLVKSCVELGARKDALTARLAGGALMLGKGISQSISEGNLSAARTILSKMGIKMAAENTGGNHMRTVRLDIATGKVYLKRPGSNWEELL